MIVEARCVAPYRHVPRGGRHVRLDHVASVHSLELPEIEPGAFDPIPMPRGARAMAARDGSAWTRLLEPACDGPYVPVARDAFLAWLSGAGPSHPVLATTFRMTPLVAALDPVHTGRGEYVTHDLTRGGEDVPASREVVLDGRGAALAALSDMLRDDVALVGDAVMVRLRPRAFLRGSPGGWQVELEPWPNGYGAAAAGLHPAPERWPAGARPLPEAAAVLAAARAREADDLRYVAHHYVHHARAALARHVARVNDRQAASLARMDPLADLASVGALTADGCRIAVEAVTDAVPILVGSPFVREAWRWREATEALDRARAVAPEDGAALAGMAP